MRDRSHPAIYRACSKEGSFLPLAKIDTAIIKSMLTLASEDLRTVEYWRAHAPRTSGQWNAIYKLAYDVLHALAECILHLDGIKAKTHECVFAHIVEHNAELSWDFFEKVRSKRNRSIYYGQLIGYNDWKEVELQLLLYIHTLEGIVQARLGR
jgi:hypothetical protein